MKKGDIRKQEILNTAELLFCRKGYEQTGIQDILDQLHTSKGSFYHHYVSKEALLEGICRRRSSQIFEAVNKTLDQSSAPLRNLNLVLSGMIPFRDEKISFLLMLLPVFRLPEGRTVKQCYCESLAGVFRSTLIRLLCEGSEKKEMFCSDPDITADLILAVVNRLWIHISEMMIEAEDSGRDTDISEILRYAEVYRTVIERLLFLPYGSVELTDIPMLKNLSEQIHNHWIHG